MYWSDMAVVWFMLSMQALLTVGIWLALARITDLERKHDEDTRAIANTIERMRIQVNFWSLQIARLTLKSGHKGNDEMP